MGEKELGMTIPIREMAKGVRIKRDNLLINRTTESVKVPITIHLPEDLKSKVDRYKKAYFRTFSSLVEKLVREWLEAVEEEEAGNGTKEDLH